MSNNNQRRNNPTNLNSINGTINNYLSTLPTNDRNTVIVDVDEYDQDGAHFRRETKRTQNSVVQTITRINTDGSRSSTTTTYSTSGNGNTSTTSSTSSSSSYYSSTNSSNNSLRNLNQSQPNTGAFNTHTPFLDRGFMDTIHQSRSNHLSNLNPSEIFEQAQRMTQQLNQQHQSKPSPQRRAFIEEIDEDEEIVIDDDDDDDKMMKKVLASSAKEYVDLEDEDLELQRAIKESMKQSQPQPISERQATFLQEPKPRSTILGNHNNPQRNRYNNNSNSNNNSSRSSPVNKRKNRNEHSNNIKYDIDEGNIIIDDDFRTSQNEERKREDNFFRNNPQTQQYLAPQTQERYQQIEEAESIRNIMQEQDREYQESLKRDQELEEQKELEKAMALSMESEKIELISNKRNAIPNEPDPNNPNSCTIAIVLPNSSRIQRRFLIENSIQDVKNWLDIYVVDQNLEFFPKYEFTMSNPRELINSSESLSETIKSAGGVKKILFKVVQID